MSRVDKLQIWVVPGAWLAFAALTERWRPWGDGIKLQYAGDVTAYEQIAHAAPGFPAHRIEVAHSDRFVPHWVVGVIAHGIGCGIHLVYQVGTALVLLAILATVVATLRALRVSGVTQAVCVGALVASAYPFRYLAISPGMITDALFVLGLAMLVHGFVTRSSRWVVAGAAVATLGRQTGLPVAVVAASILLARRSRWAALSTIATAAVCYVVPHALSANWADTSGRGVLGMTILDQRIPVGAILSHLGRCVVAVAVPLALLALGWWRGRTRPAIVPLVLGLVTLGGAIALSPGWTNAQPRLAGLAAPALVVAAAPALEAARLGALAALPLLGIALASFHHLYSRVAPDGQHGWGAFVVAGSALTLAPALRRVRAVVGDDQRASFFAAALKHAPFLAASVDGAVYAVQTDDRGVGRRLFVTRRRPEFTVLRRALTILGEPPPNSTIVDVGANIGTTTIPALLEHGFARAVACEPGPDALRMLRVNVTANGLEDRVEIVDGAISNREGVVSFETRTSSFGTHRVATRGAGLAVEALTLDTLVRRGVVDPARVALLWMDVQGHEGYVLDGAQALLAARVPVVLALRGANLSSAGGLELLLGILRDRFARVVDLREPSMREADWRPVVEPIGAVERFVAEERSTDILVLPAGGRWS